MNAKKYILAVIVLNTVLAAFAACFCHHLPLQTQSEPNATRAMAAMSGAERKFGPTVEVVLSAGKIGGPAEILDLETGRALQPPPIDLKSRADTIMGWIRSKGLDISCNVWSGGATCVTHDMSIIAVEGDRWEKATEEELIRNPALTPVRHSPRRLLVLGSNRPDTYMFRSAEGTLGMLRIAGLSEDGRGVKICYKLVTPAKSANLSPWSMAHS